jgi:uncharacterized protein
MPRKIVYIELPSGDAGRAREFWGSLMELQFQAWEGPMEYHMFDGEPGGGIYRSDEAGTGPFVYFGSEDIDADVTRTRELGGRADDKQPIPGIGWYARCHDTEGNAFSFFQSDQSVPAPAE